MTELEIVRNKAEEGREAYKNGLARDANPYRYGTARYWQWSSGWCDERAYRPSRSDRKKDDRSQSIIGELVYDWDEVVKGTLCIKYKKGVI